MSEGYFIDGLRTRADKQSGAKPLSGAPKQTSKQPARKVVTRALGDPLAQKQRNRAAEEFVKPVQSFGMKRTETTAKPEVKKVKASTTFKTSESNYRKNVLGIDDDVMEFGTDDLFKKRRREKKKRVSRKHSFRMSIAAVVLLLVVGVGAGAYFWGDSIISKITGGNAGLIDLFKSAILSDGTAKFKTDENGRTNVLMFGTSGYNMEGEVGDTTHEGAQLTDSIMVLSFDQVNGDMAMVSLQRDLLVGTCTSTGKINEIYYCANPYGKDEKAGATALEEKVVDITGLKLHYYAHINWGALVALVNSLGGITVTLDEDIADDGTNTYITAGVPKTLDGEQALGLARARHGTLGGDFSRARSQQKILIGIKDRVAERGLSFTELLNAASVLGDNLRTDFSADEIAAGAKLATTMNLASMRQVPLVGTDTGDLLKTDTLNGISYVVPAAGRYNYSAIRTYLAKNIAEPVVKESGKILVLNGSGVGGVAAKERAELEGAGFSVADIGDAPAGDYFEKYYLYAISNQPETQAKLETYYNVAVSENLPYGIDTTGVDFVVILGVGYN